MSKKLTKAEIEKLRQYSIHGETYVCLDDVQATLEAREESEKAPIARAGVDLSEEQKEQVRALPRKQ